LTILFRFFGLFAPKNFHIIYLSNILSISVPDEGYFRNVSCGLYYISTLLILYITFI
jgi:hypothetical protein